MWKKHKHHDHAVIGLQSVRRMNNYLNDEWRICNFYITACDNALQDHGIDEVSDASWHYLNGRISTLLQNSIAHFQSIFDDFRSRIILKWYDFISDCRYCLLSGYRFNSLSMVILFFSGCLAYAGLF